MTFIIAEAGVCHNGNVLIAFKLINAAIEAGADAVKFQTFKAEKIATGERRKMLKKLELSYDTRLVAIKRKELKFLEYH